MQSWRLVFTADHEDAGPHEYYVLAQSEEVAQLKARAFFRRDHRSKNDIYVETLECLGRPAFTSSEMLKSHGHPFL